MLVCYDNNLDKLVLHAGLRIPGDQRQITPTLPMHLADALTVNEGAQSFPDGSNSS